MDSGRPLHLHTLESLCTDLVSGIPIEVDSNEFFTLKTEASRAAFVWYEKNKLKWSANVQTADIEAIVTAAGLAPPSQANVLSNGKLPPPKRYILTAMTAHHFAGLHYAGTSTKKPDDFKFEFKAGISLFEGYNGSGKTSLLNAVIWALTGSILRPQRSPEIAAKDFTFEVEQKLHSIPPVVPLPDPAIEALADGAIPVNTWVELIFQDEEEKLYKVRRSLERVSKGALKEKAEGIAELGLDPISTRIGTIMPGILPYVQVGAVSELGKAVSELTGLAPLVDLAKHAEKAQRRIDMELSKTKKDEIVKVDDAYTRTRTDLLHLIRKSKLSVVESEIPLPSDKSTIETELEVLGNKLESLRTDGLSHAKRVLGKNFDAEEEAQRIDLMNCLGPALSAVSKFATQPSMTRLTGLTQLTELEANPVKEYINAVRNEASKLVEIAAQPDKAARVRLYARVMEWMRDHPEFPSNEDICAVCGHELGDAIDAITGKKVKEHLSSGNQGGDYAGKTFSKWAAHVQGELLKILPPALATEARLEPSEGPSCFIREALIEELFNDQAFASSLQPLKGVATEGFAKIKDNFPAFEFQAQPEIGKQRQEFKTLNQLIYRVERALAYRDWGVEAQPAEELLMLEVVGQTTSQERQTERQSLLGQLSQLQSLVSDLEPYEEARVKQKRLLQDIKQRREHEKRLSEYGTASLALGECKKIGQLVEKQVNLLQTRLHTSATNWRSKIYLSAFPTTSMDLVTSKTGGSGDLQLLIGSPGVAAPAQHVSNASALRASLFAFYLAYWQHIQKERGGLQCMILDDPQELLDIDNRDRLAESLYDINSAGAQLIVSTHDTRFAMSVAKRSQAKALALNHQYIHPATSRRGTIFLTPSIAKVQKLYDAFNQDPNDPVTAQDYISECRIYLEGRMGDLFDDSAFPAASSNNFSPTLSDHIGRLRSLTKGATTELFKNSAVTRFINDTALKDGAATLALLNKAHHRDKATIRPKEVYDIRVELERLRDGVEKAHEEFRKFNRREPLEQPKPTFSALIPATFFPLKFSVMNSLDELFTQDQVPQPSEEQQKIIERRFENKALFYVRSSTLGVAAPAGTVVIVDVNSSLPADRQLVIARLGNEIFARRLLRPFKSDLVALAAESVDPRKRPPTELHREEQLSCHPIEGVLFEPLSDVATSKAEVVKVLQYPSLRNVQAAYSVSDEAAIPIASPGNLILIGSELPLEMLDSYVGRYVALHLSNGRSLLMRVGHTLPLPLDNLRQFEAIGNANSEIFALDDKYEHLKCIKSVRPIVGILYQVNES